MTNQYAYYFLFCKITKKGKIGLLLVILRNNKKMNGTCIEIIEAQQAKICNNNKNSSL